MSKLKNKFKQAPQIKLVSVGDEESGVLELPKLYDLSPLENDYIEELNREYNIKSQFEEATEVADIIVKKQGETYDFDAVDKLVSLSATNASENVAQIQTIALSLQQKKRPLDVADVVSKLLSNDTAIIMENLADVMEWRDRQEKNAPIRDRILATAMLKFRIFKEEEWELGDTEQALKEEELNYKTIEALARFAEKERNHWQNVNDDGIDREELKKRLKDLETKERKSTGTKSNGG